MAYKRPAPKVEPRFDGIAQRLRGVLWTDSRSDRQARHREEWPELWSAIDDIVATIDKLDPPPPPPPMFDGSFTRLPKPDQP